MGVTSAGLLVYRRMGPRTEFLLAHPGGPLWARKDLGAWMIPKGLLELEEEPLSAALREFHEETGLRPPPITHPLAPVRQAGGKTVLCWAAEGNLDLTAFRPGEFEMEWPPRSGRRARFPEMDRVAFFDGPEALRRILPSQAPLVRETLAFLAKGA
ncbi:NUDIX domain-containing protein [Caulobacter sp. S45]|uniref:NUDIX domain-containing protein n=1 Tax=Caulobacter sp. S45 TaxID=1641861 RepID=UPI0015771845|nr:NUDIX domain-containing protein [Caulobacter sp. S45]